MKYTRKQTCEAGAIIDRVPGYIGAAYWVEDGDTRDYLIGNAIKALTETLVVLGFDVVERVAPAADTSAAHVKTTVAAETAE